MSGEQHMPITLSAKVPRRLVHRLIEYSEETGLPLQDCLIEALDEFVDCCVRLRLEFLRSPGRSKDDIQLAETAALVRQ
jgi:hypothetical protein